ncbi:MAG TPA: RNA polymerase sigma factor [Gammaproteobacteria bacterium]|jgi:RNA polymerase sigma-70 factor (ECF subfamily)
MDKITRLWRHRERYARHGYSSNHEFEELLRPHIQPLYRLAVRWCGNTIDAEDLLQAMLCKLYPMLDQIRKVDELRPWLVRVLYRQFVDGVRHKSRQPLSFSDTALSEDDDYHQKSPVAAGTPTAPPEAAFEAGVLTRHLLAALNKMPASRRALIIMHDVESYSLEEISAAMDIPVGTVKSRLHRARGRLRELLLDNDGTFCPASAYTVLRTEK